MLRIGQTLYVGLSTRTDAAGHRCARRALAEPLGYSVVKAELRDCLHLKTGATFAGTDIARARRSCSSIERASTRRNSPASSRWPCRADEPAAANCLRAGDRLILPAGNPRTAAALRDRGFHVVEVDVSELQKAEAGVTCMSLIDERP